MQRYKRKKPKKKKIGVFIVNLLICLCACPVTVHAYDSIYQDILINYKDYFVNNSIIKDAFRYIQWGIVSLLYWMADGAQSLYKNTLGLIDFTQYSGLTDLVSTLQTIFTILMALSLVYLGFVMMFNHKKVPNIISAVVLGAFTISALSSVMITANSAVIAFCNDLVPDSMADEVVNANLIDLYYVDQSCGGLDTFSADQMATYHYDIDNFDIEAIDINEVMNYRNDFLSDGGEELLKIKVSLYPDGTVNESDVYNGWGWNSTGDDDWFNEFYYRYHIDTFSICVSLIAVLIVYLCIAYKTARLIWELAIKRILALLYAADMGGSQKTIKILGNIKDTYCMLMFTAIILKIFTLFNLWLSEKYAGNGFTYCMILLFVSMAVIDGPNIIQQLTGEDAGLQSAFGKMTALYSGARGAVRNTTGHMANGIRSVVAAKRHHDLTSALGKTRKGLNNAGANNLKSGSDSSGKNNDIQNAMKDSNKKGNDPLRTQNTSENDPKAKGKMDTAKSGNDDLRAAMRGDHKGKEQSIDPASTTEATGKDQNIDVAAADIKDQNADIADAMKADPDQKNVNEDISKAAARQNEAKGNNPSPGTANKGTNKNLPPKAGNSTSKAENSSAKGKNISEASKASITSKAPINNESSNPKNIRVDGSSPSRVAEKEKMQQINRSDNLK